MANGCSEIGGNAIPSTSFCLMPEGHTYEGLVTYGNGRVAAVLSDSKEAPVFLSSNGKRQITLPPDGLNLETIADMQGLEIGDCDSAGESRYVILPTVTPQGRHVSWTGDHLRLLQRAMDLDQRGVESGKAFLCSNREDPYALAFNRNAKDKLTNAINTLRNDRLGFDADHYDILMKSLLDAAGVPAPQQQPDHTKDLVGVGITFTLVGVVTSLLGAAGKALWNYFWKGPPGGGPPAAGGGDTQPKAKPQGEGSPAQETQPARRSYIVEAVGDGDGAGVRVIQGDFDPLPVETPLPAPTRSYSDLSAHEFSPALWILGGLTAIGLVVASDGAALPEVPEIMAMAFGG